MRTIPLSMRKIENHTGFMNIPDILILGVIQFRLVIQLGGKADLKPEWHLALSSEEGQV